MSLRLKMMGLATVLGLGRKGFLIATPMPYRPLAPALPMRCWAICCTAMRMISAPSWTAWTAS